MSNDLLYLNTDNKCGGKEPKKCTCTPSPTDIQVSKEERVPEAPDFVGYTHKNNTPFTLQQLLDIKQRDELPSSVQGVTKVTVYYWSKDENQPLLLEVTKSSNDKKEYYYKRGPDEAGNTKQWLKNTNEHPLQERLDDRNCGVNKTIAFEIQRDNIATNNAIRSSCITQKRSVTSTVDLPNPPGDQYIVKGYKINREDTRISRATFRGKNVDGINTSTDFITEVRVYSWKHEKDIPLLIEFKQKSGQSTWFANKEKDSLKWESVGDTTGFYQGTEPKPQPTQALTDKLDEVNCQVNNDVTIDVSKTETYCHHNHDPKKISVSPLPGSSSKLINYKAYQHTPNGNPTFTILGFNNGSNRPISLPALTLPVKGAKKVVVFMCESGDTKIPLLIYLPDDKSVNKWFKSTDQGNTWQEVGQGTLDSVTNYPRIAEFLDSFKTPCGPKEVTVNIKERNNGNSAYRDPASKELDIKLSKKDFLVNNASSGYFEYVHELPDHDKRKDFTLRELRYGKYPIEGLGTPVKGIKSVSAYYWSGLESKPSKPVDQRGRPLLIKITNHDGTIRCYENDGNINSPNTRWAYFCTDPAALKKKLDEANCKLNGVVQIDVLKTSQYNGQPKIYCHTGHDHSYKPKIKVSDITPGGNKLGMYRAYAHTPAVGHSLDISDFTKNGIPIDSNAFSLPVMDATRIIVFMCASGRTSKTPLLIYVEAPGRTSPGNQWFKSNNEGYRWMATQPEETPQDAESYTQILDLLDKLASPCQPPSVTIKINNRKPAEESVYESVLTSKKTIDVIPTNPPTVKGFTEYTHTIRHWGSYFTVNNFQYGDEDTSGLVGSVHKVTSISVFYWSALETSRCKDISRPLLVKIVKYDSPSVPLYYENIGTVGDKNWKQVRNGHELRDQKLYAKLELLSCRLNKGVQIDVSKTPQGEETYCHDHGKGRKMSVKVQGIPTHGRLREYKVFEHSHRRGGTFIISWFKNGVQNIMLKDFQQNLPLLDVERVVVYTCYCDPLLLYVDLPDIDPSNKWFKKSMYSNYTWEAVNGTSPQSPTSYSEILELLDTIDSKCRLHVVTIDIKQRPNTEKTYGPLEGSTTEIQLSKNVDGVPSGYVEYLHELPEGKRKIFILKGAQYGDTPIIGLGSPIENVVGISVYYWSGLENGSNPKNSTGRPLLLKLTRGSRSIKWYENTGDSKDAIWASFCDGLSDYELKKRLDEINCTVNGVVQIDASKISPYCHAHCKVPRIKVDKLDISKKLFNYRAYQHTLNISAKGNYPDRFHISGFRNGNSVIDPDGFSLPIVYTTRVIVYLCPTRLSNTPLLMYVPETSLGSQWLRSGTEDGAWQVISTGYPSNDTDYPTIVGILDKLESKCKPPEVRIDIYERDPTRKEYLYEDKTARPREQTIDVIPNTRSAQGFTEYIHTIRHWGSYFTVSNLRYKGKITVGFSPPLQKVESVSVFYWTGLEDASKEGKRGRPLLVKVTTMDIASGVAKQAYFENTGSQGGNNVWNGVKGSLSGATLKHTLDLLNCKLNNAVIIEINERPVDSPDAKYYDACDSEAKKIHSDHSNDRMQVSRNDGDSDKLKRYSAYDHSLKNSPGHPFHIAGFRSRTSAIVSGLPTNIIDVSLVKVYMCNCVPLLVHIESTLSTNKWFKETSTYNWEVVAPPIDKVPSGSVDYDGILGVLDSLKSDCGPPSIRLDVSRKDNYKEYYDPKSQENILVVKHSGQASGDPPQHYELYKHIVRGREMSYFTLGNTVYNGKEHEINGTTGGPVQDVTSASVYYWSRIEKSEPLLVKVTQAKSKTNPKDTVDVWYENTGTNGNPQWKLVDESDYLYRLSDPYTLETKLHSLVQRFNNGVVIDVCKKSSSPYVGLIYRHGGEKRGIRVKRVMSQDLETYHAYRHTLYSDDISIRGKPFHVVGLKNGNSGSLQLQDDRKNNGNGTPASPIMNVTEVIVYFCPKYEESPLLIFFEQKTAGEEETVTHRWYRKPGRRSNEWKCAGGSSFKGEHPECNNFTILEALDQIHNPCQPPSVTIDIKRGSIEKYVDPVSLPDPHKEIYVNSETHPPGSEYKVFKHTVKDTNGRKGFTAVGATYGEDGNLIDGICRDIKEVTSFNTYYWTHDDGRTSPLLIEVVKNDPSKTIWYENSGKDDNTNWKRVTQPPDPTELKDTTKLKTKLDNLNSKLNNAVVVVVSVKPGDPDSTKDYKPDNSGKLNLQYGDKRMEAKDVTPSDTPPPLVTYKAYSHSLADSSNKSFNIVGIKNTDKSGKSTDIVLQGGKSKGTPASPIMNVTKVIVYFCPLQPDQPLLIFYEQKQSTSKENDEEANITYNWYKKPYRGNEWTRAGGGLFQGYSPKRDDATILLMLDEIDSPCRPPKVTIDLQRQSTYTSNCPEAGKEVKVDTAPIFEGSEYNVFKHIVPNTNGRDNFTIAGVDYGRDCIGSEFKDDIKGAKDLSTYYWGPLKENGNPLLVKVVKNKDVGSGTETVWYENVSKDGKNAEWKKIQDPSRIGKLSNGGKALEEELDRMNNHTNRTVKIDLSSGLGKTVDSTIAEDGVATSENPLDGIVQVTDVTRDWPYAGKFGKNLSVYSYDISDEVKNRMGDGATFNVTSLTSGNGDIILPPDIDPNSLLGVSKIVTFNKNDGKEGKPVLCCIEYNNGGEQKTLWLQSSGAGGGTYWFVNPGMAGFGGLAHLSTIQAILKTLIPVGGKFSIISIAKGVGVFAGLPGAGYWFYCFLMGRFKWLRKNF